MRCEFIIYRLVIFYANENIIVIVTVKTQTDIYTRKIEL